MAIEKIKILGADYSFELIFNETCAPQFNGHNNSFLASVLIDEENTYLCTLLIAGFAKATRRTFR